MPEETKKKEVNYHANMDAAEAIPQAKRLITNIGFKRGSVDKYEIYFVIPDSDEEAKSRYDCTLAELVAMGVRKISTSPQYPAVMFNEDGTLKPKGHEAGQELADGYKVGQRSSAGPTQKKIVQEHNLLIAEAAEAGYTTAELIALAKANKRKRAKK